MRSDELTIVAEAPARGAGLNQVIGLSIAAVVITLLLLWVGYAHRTHRIHWLTGVADKLGDKFHRPGWVALPVLVFTTSIICALFGFIWDVSWHIGNGRDPGPLANPAHYFIIIGLFGIFLGGMTAETAEGCALVVGLILVQVPHALPLLWSCVSSAPTPAECSPTSRLALTPRGSPRSTG